MTTAASAPAATSQVPSGVTQSRGLLRLLESLSEDHIRRGAEFERVCKWFLENDPLYKSLLRKVWLWKDWPDRWGRDAGIDLVAETRDGRLWALQAKAYSPEYWIRKKDVDTFLSESSRSMFAYRLLIGTTDHLGPTAQQAMRGQQIPAHSLLLSELLASSVTWPKSLKHLIPARPKPKRPMPHQNRALKDVLDGLSRGDCGQLVMACGTGKTLTSLFIAEAMKAPRVLFLVPSLSLLSQVVKAWTDNATSDLRIMAVCSDASVTEPDELVEHASDLAFPVTTSPAEIRSMLSSRRSGRLVVFCTYQSSPQVAKAMKGRGIPQFDLIIADEAHRLAGDVSADLRYVLRPKAIRRRKTLFMTATPKYFTGRVKRAANQDRLEVASMDDKALFGPILHRLTFGQAISKGLLSDYRVAVIGVDDDMYLDWSESRRFVKSDELDTLDASQLASHIGLAKAFREFEIRRAISFHSRVASARRFSRLFPDVVGWMPAAQRPKGKVSADYISGDMSAGARRSKLAMLAETEGSSVLLSNARCLTEGIDVPALDGVAFIDPRESKTDIVQAVGRAIRRSPDKRAGTIVLPVFIGRGGEIEKALTGSAFAPAWAVLRALRAHDEDLGQALDELRRGLGERPTAKRRLPSKIYLDLPEWVTPEFARAVAVRLIEESTSDWHYNYGLLKAYVDREKTALLPAKHVESGVKLGSWVSVQRGNRNLLAPDRKALLEQLRGWSWEPIEDAWRNGYAHLVAYADRTKSARAPRAHMENGFRLGQWVTVQRSRFRSGSLSEERIRLLEELPKWSWDPYDDDWAEALGHLETYVRRTKSALVPRDHMEAGFPLGAWVATQRSRKEKLPRARQRELEAFRGWSWNLLDDAWVASFAGLRAFSIKNGHCQVPYGYTEGGVRLGLWVSNVRRRRHSLAADRVKSLEALQGWAWSVNDAKWERGFALLCRYQKREKSALVPQRHQEDGFALGSWVGTQRNQRRSMAAARRKRLESVKGWTWLTRAEPRTWDQAFELLRGYVKREKSALVPRRHLERGFRLGQWVAKQRSQKPSLSRSQVKALESLRGWVWKVR